MPVAVTNRIVVTEFNRMLGDLGNSLSGVKFKQIIKGEAASVLSLAAKLTKAASKQKIRSKYTIKGRQRKDMPSEYQERKAPKGKQKKGSFKKKIPKGAVKGSKVPQNPNLVKGIKINGVFHNSSYYYPKPVWDKMKAKMKFFKERALNRRMSGKATWLLIAQKARLPTRRFDKKGELLSAIRAQGGNYARNKTENGTQKKKRFSFYIEAFNGANCCLNKSARGVYAIRSAMARRIKFYEVNLRQGVFNKLKDEVKAYPNVFVER